jgi:hypothetical protein
VYARDQATDTWRATGLVVVVMAGDRITELTRFEVGVTASFGPAKPALSDEVGLARSQSPPADPSSRHRE